MKRSWAFVLTAAAAVGLSWALAPLFSSGSRLPLRNLAASGALESDSPRGGPARDDVTRELAERAPGSRSAEDRPAPHETTRNATVAVPDAPDDVPPGPSAALTGLEVEAAGPDALAAAGTPVGMTGVVVKSLDPASPAIEASLQPGDVIVRAHRKKIDSTEALQRIVGDRRHTMLVVYRKGVPFEVVLHAPFMPEAAGEVVDTPSGNR